MMPAHKFPLPTVSFDLTSSGAPQKLHRGFPGRPRDARVPEPPLEALVAQDDGAERIDFALEILRAVLTDARLQQRADDLTTCES